MDKAPPIPEAVPGVPAVVQAVPFQSHLIITQNDQQVQVNGWWSFPTRAAAQAAIESLDAPRP